MPPRIPEPTLESEERPGAGPAVPPGSGGRADLRDPLPARGAIPTHRWYGVYPGLVLDPFDPERLGRVKVALPWIPDAGGISGFGKGGRWEGWARLATLAAGEDRGSWFLPEVDDEVLVAFEAGHPSRPVVVGTLWNGRDTPPVAADQENRVKLLRTRGGSEIRFHDDEGEESVEIRTSGGESIRLENAGGGTVRIRDSHGNRVRLGSGGIILESPADIRLEGSSITLKAGSVAVESGMLSCTGVLKGQTLIADAVVAGSYTPGAGNIA